MDYAILPFKTAKFLRLLRKAQIDQSRMVSYDGFFVISTFRIGNQPVKDINVEKYSNSIRSMLLSLRDLGYLTFCDSAGELFQLTDMGWHYHEVSLRGALKLFAQSILAPLAVSVLGTILTQLLLFKVCP